MRRATNSSPPCRRGSREATPARSTLVNELTQAVARAEGKAFDEVKTRVWVFPVEIPDGLWGSRGEIRRNPQIQAFFNGEAAGEAARQRLADRQRAKAIGALDAVLNAARKSPG